MAERTSALTAGGHKSICVYDGQLNLLGRLASWVSLVWPERYNVYSGVQGAQLELHASTALQALCRFLSLCDFVSFLHHFSCFHKSSLMFSTKFTLILVLKPPLAMTMETIPNDLTR